MSARKKPDYDFQVQRNLALIRDEGRCVAFTKFGLEHECTGWLPPHVHHKRRRSQGGSNELDNLETVCAQAHAMVHSSHAKFAIECGLLIGTEYTDAQILGAEQQTETETAA